MTAKHVHVTGRVQGVSFRAWTREQAQALGLSGWVRNRPDGSLEAVVSGPDEVVEALITALHEGPPAAVVEDIDAAIAHVGRYGSQHTDAILTEDAQAAARFFERVDSAIVMHNASTQFADGGEFGMGAEIGIATGTLHARGPVGAEQLTSFKYLVSGDGTIRS